MSDKAKVTTQQGPRGLIATFGDDGKHSLSVHGESLAVQGVFATVFLSREKVAAMLPFFEQYARTGKLAEPTGDDTTPTIIER